MRLFHEVKDIGTGADISMVEGKWRGSRRQERTFKDKSMSLIERHNERLDANLFQNFELCHKKNEGVFKKKKQKQKKMS